MSHSPPLLSVVLGRGWSCPCSSHHLPCTLMLSMNLHCHFLSILILLLELLHASMQAFWFCSLSCFTQPCNCMSICCFCAVLASTCRTCSQHGIHWKYFMCCDSACAAYTCKRACSTHTDALLCKKAHCHSYPPASPKAALSCARVSPTKTHPPSHPLSICICTRVIHTPPFFSHPCHSHPLLLSCRSHLSSFHAVFLAFMQFAFMQFSLLPCRGHLSQGKSLMAPYLPRDGASTSSPFSEGGAL